MADPELAGGNIYRKQLEISELDSIALKLDGCFLISELFKT